MIPSSHQTGKYCESLVLNHCTKKGYRVVAKNWRTPFGELDLLIADPDSGKWIALEIKSLSHQMSPADRISIKQQKRLFRILQFIQTKNPNTVLRYVFVKPKGQILQINPFD